MQGSKENKWGNFDKLCEKLRNSENLENWKFEKSKAKKILWKMSGNGENLINFVKTFKKLNWEKLWNFWRKKLTNFLRKFRKFKIEKKKMGKLCENFGKICGKLLKKKNLGKFCENLKNWKLRNFAKICEKCGENFLRNFGNLKI